LYRLSRPLIPTCRVFLRRCSRPSSPPGAGKATRSCCEQYQKETCDRRLTVSRLTVMCSDLRTRSRTMGGSSMLCLIFNENTRCCYVSLRNTLSSPELPSSQVCSHSVFTLRSRAKRGSTQHVLRVPSHASCKRLTNPPQLTLCVSPTQCGASWRRRASGPRIRAAGSGIRSHRAPRSSRRRAKTPRQSRKRTKTR